VHTLQSSALPEARARTNQEWKPSDGSPRASSARRISTKAGGSRGSGELRRDGRLMPRPGVLWNSEYARVLPPLFGEFELPGLVASQVTIRREPDEHHQSNRDDDNDSSRQQQRQVRKSNPSQAKSLTRVPQQGDRAALTLQDFRVLGRLQASWEAASFPDL
jgi:hypothetical protein